MAIKLSATRLPSTTAELLAPLTGSSSSGMQEVGQGLAIPEVYLQDKDGVIGGVRLGVELNVWIPARHIPTDPTRKHKIVIGGTRYEIADIQEKFYKDGANKKPIGRIEPYYVFNIIQPNAEN